MDLRTYLSNGSFPDGVASRPTSPDPAWCRSLLAALVGDHASQRVAKTGDEKLMTEVGLASVIGEDRTEQLVNAMLNIDTGMPGLPAAARDRLRWQGRKFREGKGTIEYTDQRVPTGLTSLVTLGLISEAEKLAIIAFWTRPAKVWEAQGLDALPSGPEIYDALSEVIREAE